MVDSENKDNLCIKALVMKVECNNISDYALALSPYLKCRRKKQRHRSKTKLLCVSVPLC